MAKYSADLMSAEYRKRLVTSCLMMPNQIIPEDVIMGIQEWGWLYVTIVCIWAAYEFIKTVSVKVD